MPLPLPKSKIPAPDAPVYLALYLATTRRGVRQYQLSASTIPFLEALVLKRSLNRGRKHPRAAIVALNGTFISLHPRVAQKFEVIGRKYLATKQAGEV